MIMISILSITMYAQTTKDTAKQVIYSANVKVDVYKLFPTVNMWTFLKLDTRNGRIWQVQWALKEEQRFEIVLSGTPLVSTDENTNGRFTLYPATNNYNFILLDQISGKTWQVQWSQESANRGILPIN